MSKFAARRFAAAVAGMVCTGAAAAATIPVFTPNPGVGWLGLSNEYLPPPSGPGPVMQDPAHPRVTNLEALVTGKQPTLPVADIGNPILLPWVRNELATRNALVLAGKGGISRQANCWPVGVPQFDVYLFMPIFFVQGPKEVLILWEGDHQVRHIYLDAKHSPHAAPSWFGESIGHYEGDTLVVDTIGLNTKTNVDIFYTPHTEQLHVVERFRIIDGGKTLETKVHIEDPGAFTMPWDAVVHHVRVEPGVAENPNPISANVSSHQASTMIEMSCTENPVDYFGGVAPVPIAAAPDF